MADVVVVPQPPPPPPPPPIPQQHLFVIPTIPSYNISLNLTSILSLLPSKSFLTRSGLFRSIRRKWWENVADMHGEVVPVPLMSPSEALGSVKETRVAAGLVDIAAWPSESMLEAVVNEVAPGAPTISSSSTGSSSPPPLLPGNPGPWGFFLSGYILGLLLVAVFLHRIQNIIVPSQVPRRRRLARRLQRVPVVGAIWDAMFPLDLSKTSTRLMLYLPTLNALLKTLLVWTVLVLQTSQLYPENTQVAWIRQVGLWVETMEMSDICWKTFLAVCSAFAVEGFVKSLDGVEAGFPIGSNMNPNTSPFNIVGYAFLLHLYASPYAHSIAPFQRGDVRMPSRPHRHAVITVAIPLLQLTMFHVLAVSKRLSTHRLLPTTLSSALSLIHFHTTLLSYFYGASWWRQPTTTTTTTTSRGHGVLITYPILNYVPNIFETLLILSIVLTVVLNILVQLVVRGRVDRVFSGLGIRATSPLRSGIWRTRMAGTSTLAPMIRTR